MNLPSIEKMECSTNVRECFVDGEFFPVKDVVSFVEEPEICCGDRITRAKGYSVSVVIPGSFVQILLMDYVHKTMIKVTKMLPRRIRKKIYNRSVRQTRYTFPEINRILHEVLRNPIDILVNGKEMIIGGEEMRIVGVDFSGDKDYLLKCESLN